MTERMPNGERGEEPLAGNTDCQDQDTTPLLAPLKANLLFTLTGTAVIYSINVMFSYCTLSIRLNIDR